VHPFEDVVDAFAAGVYLLFGVVYLDLARRRHGQGGPLWLAAACFGALTVDLTGMMARHRLPERDALLHAVNLGAAALTTVFLRELASSLARERSGFATRALESLSVPLAAGAALAGSPPLALGAFALILLLLGGALVTTARIPRGGAPEAMLVAVGFAILLFCLIGDVLMLVGVLPRLFGLPVAGFVSFFLAAAIATNRRSERERIELEQLRAELEGRVDERTRELSAANARLAEASRTDTLTGLLNRRGFLAAWEADRARASRSGRPSTLVLADLDRFKEVNDSAGHLVGDALLQRVAAAFAEILRAQDVAARWGGEEFIFLLPETALAGGIEVAEKLRRTLADRQFECEGTAAIRITASFGVAEHVPGERLERTVAAADAALYRAKDAGRNRVEAA
jgi:diguanylate cyclase (GGDEF)-like protein